MSVIVSLRYLINKERIACLKVKKRGQLKIGDMQTQDELYRVTDHWE
jgi:hypothetical protein